MDIKSVSQARLTDFVNFDDEDDYEEEFEDVNSEDILDIEEDLDDTLEGDEE